MQPSLTPPWTLAEVAQRLEGVLEGPADRPVHGVRPLTQAGPGDITFLEDRRLLPQLASCKAGVVLVDTQVAVPPHLAVIRVAQPHLAFARLLEALYPRRNGGPGVSPQAIVDRSATIGAGCNLYPGSFIGAGARLGPRTDVYPGVSIGEGCVIGSDCILYPNVVVYRDCELGDRVILHAGVVIGADGFGYAQKQQADRAEPVIHYKVPQIGKVVIEDDVEVGANSTIDRAALDETRIGRGTKIDNLVMIGHNCDIGRHCILVAQVGISGSTKVGHYVTLAGQAGIVGHISIGDGAIIGAQAGVTKDVPSGKTVIGAPAIDAAQARRAYALIELLPEYRRRIQALEKRLAALEAERRAAPGP